jgi:2-polyprenyl-3-methyl-5-hydroxy-6-metoxy-1,4-benzoquinol methylase
MSMKKISSEFPAYKKEYLSAIRKVLSESSPHVLDEAAFPAYAHPNPIINTLFWLRLRYVMKNIEKTAPYDAVLDFGCGSGVLLPFLAKVSKKVVGVDINLEPLEKVTKYIQFPVNIGTVNLNQVDLASFPQESFNLITALDVLEHVNNLEDTLDQLMGLLKPNGRLVISLPTENIFYKIGRRLAGRNFTGDYHIVKISDIEKTCRQKGNIAEIANLFPVFSFFKIFSLEKRRG